MTTERRLAKLEASLAPTGLVRRWLAEAHTFDDLDAYVRWLLDQPTGAYPLDRLAREAADGARADVRARPRGGTEAAIRMAIRETVFRVDLVFRIVTIAHEIIEREMLVHAVLAQHFAIAAGLLTPTTRSAPRENAEDVARCHRLIALRCTELRAAEIARTRVEARYLDGQVALFPAGLRQWNEQREQTEGLVAIAIRLAVLDGAKPMDPPGDPSDARVTAFMADLVEPARVTALDKLGEGARAHALAVRWLRPKFASGAAGQD